jgi:uncharacterized membrane protein YcjF (UPF0283 family)
MSLLPEKLRGGLQRLWSWRWRLGRWFVPLSQALWVNHRHMPRTDDTPDIRHSVWTASELDRLLDQSHDRLRSIEGKGPGLATVSAVVGAALGLAISETWQSATLAQQMMLVAATVYTFVSLLCPILLVGSVRRNMLTLSKLAELSHKQNGAVEALNVKTEAIAKNDWRNGRLANLQSACTYDLRNAVLLLAAWSVTLLLTSL